MGVPKFFRWISERYPLCSQLIQENNIPEFDNLYLDMNGIIHPCSHPNDNDPHFRLSEGQIFTNIFNYIDVLFSKIKPKRTFFMAVDGVAPRAKMNQQRARRFRSAKEAHDNKQKAIRNGEVLPEEDPFDSNCITPGTEFMKRLSEHLKYFIKKKITEDSNWRNVEIILSGHEVPGEGEHKIMEYIRLSKAQPDYDHNIRHCLYGLDADLIMLGLLSHEPHFALLREEVTFGRKKRKVATVESQNFYLLHLTIFREYLECEFYELKNKLPFPYDFERIIDDFILFAYFVGNDFLPNLPHMNIADDALALMFNLYKRILPRIGGYMNEFGALNMKGCQFFLRGLADYERECFENTCGDVRWLKGKRGDEKFMTKDDLESLTPNQATLLNTIYDFVSIENRNLNVPDDLKAEDRAFVQRLSRELGLNYIIAKKGTRKSVSLQKKEGEDLQIGSMREQVLQPYIQLPIIDPLEIDVDKEESKRIDEEFMATRKQYYLEKLNINVDEPSGKKDLEKLVYSYLEGLQWILHYYYKGVASWGWFYPYHYPPLIYDACRFDYSTAKASFTRGKPFLPFEQLMGVLPAASSTLVPSCYRDLMKDPDSPIYDFYPVKFEEDLNGKKNDWEAIVKIPFIEEKRLIAALNSRKLQLTPEENQRNSFGLSYQFKFDKNVHHYPSPCSMTFPDIIRCTCKMEEYYLPVLEGGITLRHGLLDNVRLGKKAMAGFPTLHTLPHDFRLDYAKVAVFNSESKGQSVIISIKSDFGNTSSESIAKQKIGKRVFVGWPYLSEARIVAISDDMFRYELDHHGPQTMVVKYPHEHSDLNVLQRSATNFEESYHRRYATEIGSVEILVHTNLLKGMKLLNNGALVKDYVEEETSFPLQLIVDQVVYEDPRYEEKGPPPLELEYPKNSPIYYLGEENYGCPGKVIGHHPKSLIVKLIIQSEEDTSFGRRIVEKYKKENRYVPGFIAARELNLSSLVLARITSSLHVFVTSTNQRYNLGLNLKNDNRQLKVAGYTERNEKGWTYSDRAVDLLRQYIERFPEFFSGLQEKPKADIFLDTGLYPEDIAKEKVIEISRWLKEGAKVDTLATVSLDCDSLPVECIKEMELEIDQNLKGQSMKPHTETTKVPVQYALKPAHGTARLNEQHFDLGDRVMFALDSGTVPIALKGVVVGIIRGKKEQHENTKLEVLFDHSFISGTTLDGRCQDYRGMTLPKSSVLNLTTPQLPHVPGGRQRKGNGYSKSNFQHQNSGSQPHPSHQQIRNMTKSFASTTIQADENGGGSSNERVPNTDRKENHDTNFNGAASNQRFTKAKKERGSNSQQNQEGYKDRRETKQGASITIMKRNSPN